MRIAISSGHNKGTGARACDGTDEWSHNERLRPLIVKELEALGHTVQSFERDSSKRYGSAMRKLAKQIKQFEADVCVELHFNVASPSAHGYEFLYYKPSKGGVHLARCLSKEYQTATGGKFTPRRGNGILPRGRWDRGSTYLRVTPCPAIIAEMGFASNPSEWRQMKASLAQQAKGIAYGLHRYESER